jgi:hypothetical protein
MDVDDSGRLFNKTVPGAAARLWGARFGRMSFGPAGFRQAPRPEDRKAPVCGRMSIVSASMSRVPVPIICAVLSMVFTGSLPGFRPGMQQGSPPVRGRPGPARVWPATRPENAQARPAGGKATYRAVASEPLDHRHLPIFLAERLVPAAALFRRAAHPLSEDPRLSTVLSSVVVRAVAVLQAPWRPASRQGRRELTDSTHLLTSTQV